MIRPPYGGSVEYLEKNVRRNIYIFFLSIKVVCKLIFLQGVDKPYCRQHLITDLTGFIRKTCPCNEYPLIPHFYIAKLGYAGVYHLFYFLIQNKDCGYLLEPPRRGGSNVYPRSMF